MKNYATIKAIEYYLPEKVLSNHDLSAEFPEWSAEKIEVKTGIAHRHIAADDEAASDLALMAAQKLFASGACCPEQIDFILFCTQSPDYFLPTTACILQNKLGIPTTAGALDYNLGCSGFVYGLSLAKGLIESGQVGNVLLITAETYSKYIAEKDRNVKTIFGDAAAAIFIEAVSSENEQLGPFVFGSDGAGYKNLIVKNGASRALCEQDSSLARLYMNGPLIFHFTLASVPVAIEQLLAKVNCQLDDVDLFIFHQANEYMLKHLRDKLGICKDKFYIDMKDYGNTVSSTIPIALANAIKDPDVNTSGNIMLVGFGVGYSWGACFCSVNFVGAMT